MWVALNLSVAVVVLGAEAIELSNWLLCFGCASEDLRVSVARMANWMANSYPPCAVYRALTECRLVALNKRPELRPVEIGYQANMVCGNLQLCSGLESGMEGETNAVGQWRLDMSR